MKPGCVTLLYALFGIQQRCKLLLNLSFALKFPKACTISKNVAFSEWKPKHKMQSNSHTYRIFQTSGKTGIRQTLPGGTSALFYPQRFEKCFPVRFTNWNFIAANRNFCWKNIIDHIDVY